MALARAHRIDAFDLPPGRALSGRYEVIAQLGAGWEGEVYLVRERATGIERAAKLFYPHRNPGDRRSKIYAQKLHKLRHCHIVIPYHAHGTVQIQRTPVTFLLSDYVTGAPLSEFLRRQPGQRLDAFAALHLLHALACGVECIHAHGEYHGDLHTENIIVHRVGLHFELRLLDLFPWEGPKRESLREDVVQMVRVLYDSVGGRRHYARQPEAVKRICAGLKRGLILERFPTVRRLRLHLESMTWG